VRRFENRRDDPLIDEALEGLGALMHADGPQSLKEGKQKMNAYARPQTLPDEETLAREARRILRRLCETGSVLALAPDLGKAVVLRNRGDENAAPVRTAVVDRDIGGLETLSGRRRYAPPHRRGRYHKLPRATCGMGPKNRGRPWRGDGSDDAAL
jgi:hypothetical protein